MGGRRRLAGGFGRFLPDHRTAEGVRWRRYLRAGVEIVGILDGSELVRLELERYAKAGVLHDQATQHWAALLHRREIGKGRRPNERRIERAARRVGLADLTLKECTARLEQLATSRKPPTLAEVIRQQRSGA